MSRTIKFLFLSFVFFSAFSLQIGFAQDSCFNCNHDSLARQLPLKKTDEDKIRILRLLVDLPAEFAIQPTDKSMTYLEQLVGLNKINPSIDGPAYETMYHAYLQWRNGHLDSALNSLKKTVELFDQQKRVIATLLSRIRLLYNQLNKQEERLQYYKEKLAYYLLNGPIENTAACYHGIGGYYRYKADYNLAISNYFRAAAVYKTFYQRSYNNDIGVIGVTYAIWGNDEKADYYLKIALPLHKALGDSTNISFCLGPLTKLATKQKKYDQALQYADEAIQYTDKNANDPTYAIAVMQKVFVYLAMGQPALAYPYLMQVKALNDRYHFQLASTAGELESDLGFYQYYQALNDQKTAGAYLLAAYDKAVAEKSNVLQLKYLRELASFYEKQQPALAIQYIGKYFQLNDTIEKELNKLKVAQYENEQKDLEQNQSINSLKQERTIQEATISKSNTIMWISISALVLIALSMIFLYRQFHLNKKTLRSLRKTQRQLILSEKMASLGELTAGIAHEIQNPLNFVNNFSEVNTELIDEMRQGIDKGDINDIKTIAADIRDNQEKITYHGKRADAIVKGMLQHSRSSSGVKEPTDINALADEYLRLAYHGLRAKDKSFNATMKTDFNSTIGNINIIPQDIGRVILNLITNAFYAVTEKKKQQPEGFDPIVTVSTKKINGKVEIKVRDNGNGIPQKVLDKIFHPFFTTKPTGEGTGLGLSLSYDIIKAHGGELKAETKEGEFAEFIITLPD